jgi:hypothetical protein
MSVVSEYIDKFFIKGKIIVRSNGVIAESDKKLFNSIVRSLHVEHPRFVEKCTKEKILKIDEQNLIIELIV